MTAPAATPTAYAVALVALADRVLAVNQAMHPAEADALKSQANEIARFYQYQSAPRAVVALVEPLITFAAPGLAHRWTPIRTAAQNIKAEIAKIATTAATPAQTAARKRTERAIEMAAAALVNAMELIKEENAGGGFIEDDVHALACAMARTAGLAGTIQTCNAYRAALRVPHML